MSLLLNKQAEDIEKSGPTVTKVIKVFEYRQNNNRYLDKAKLYEQIINKALLIVEALYLGYSLVFLFDNATSHLVYIKNVLYTEKINKRSGEK